MNKSILLDTCFLISFVDDTRTYHNNALAYYKYFIEEGISMYLSSIVSSEFSIKQPLEDLPLSSFKTISFNIPDGYATSKIYNEFSKEKSTGVCRSCVKDDIKLLGLCEFNNIEYIITEDKKFYDKLVKLKKDGIIKVNPIFTPDGFTKSFKLQTNLFDPALDLVAEASKDNLPL